MFACATGAYYQELAAQVVESILFQEAFSPFFSQYHDSDFLSIYRSLLI